MRTQIHKPFQIGRFHSGSPQASSDDLVSRDVEISGCCSNSPGSPGHQGFDDILPTFWYFTIIILKVHLGLGRLVEGVATEP